jgi:hypothetical protein
LDTREETSKNISRKSSFVSLALPRHQNLDPTLAWITECVPELGALDKTREGALGLLAYGGLGIRFHWDDVIGKLDGLIESVSPYYEGETRVKVHIVGFLGGGTIGALPVLLAALGQVTRSVYEFNTIVHLVLPQPRMSRNRYETYQRQLRNSYVIAQFLRVASGATPVSGRSGNNGFPDMEPENTNYTVTVYPDRVVHAVGPHFDLALFHRAPKDDISVQTEYVARSVATLLADGADIGADWWGRHSEFMRDSTSEVDARFGSATSREFGFLDDFFGRAAHEYIQSRWVVDE